MPQGQGDSGWTTKYVGLPATLPSDSPFASTASGTDADLTTYSFGEPDRCSPCFEDGTTGIPLRLPNGELVQGMKGSIAVAKPEPAGKVSEPVSADGSHFVFGSEQKFEPAGNSGSPTLYERDMNAGGTQVVSTMPNGSTMSGDPAELDISADGGRVLIGVPVGPPDADGNIRYALYMHVGTSANSVLVADTPEGVLYDGMSDDGTTVYFTTSAHIADDTDSSPDIFRATVGTGSASVSRVSTGTGGTGNSDECEPPDDWNVSEGGPNCGALAFAGGAGVASGDGSIYFMSPEQLDGGANGLPNQPNLYVSRPARLSPTFVGLMDDSLVKPPPEPPRHPVLDKELRRSHPAGHARWPLMKPQGDVYVVEIYQGRISRFDSEGNPHHFTAGPGPAPTRSPGRYRLAQRKRRSESTPIRGHPSSAISIRGRIPKPSGYSHLAGKSLANSPGSANRAVWRSIRQPATSMSAITATGESENSTRNRPPVLPVDKEDYEETSIKTQGMNPCQVAAGGGYAYASSYSQGPLRRYPMSEFAESPPSLLGTQVSPGSRNMYVDAGTGEIYVMNQKVINVFTSDENEELPSAQMGLGLLGYESYGVAVNAQTHHVFATNEEHVIQFGYEEVPYRLIDNPAVLHATEQASTHRSDDFQITPDGDVAAFASAITQVRAVDRRQCAGLQVRSGRRPARLRLLLPDRGCHHRGCVPCSQWQQSLR